MRSLGLRTLRLLLVAGALSVSFSFANVLPFDYSNDFDLYGRQPNLCPVTNPKGICAAVAAINSFIYLQQRYPNLYDDDLVPNLQGDGTDPMDAMAFGVDGWQVGTNPARQGYYPRPGDAYGDYIATKRDWIEDRVPGVTRYEVRYAGAGGLPDIAWLAEQIRLGQDVEFFVLGGDGFFHALTLTGVSCSDFNYTDCAITYQDPNAPNAHQSTAIAPTGAGGQLQFTGLPGSNYAGLVGITGAFAESAVPEPATFLLIGGSLVALVVVRRRAGGRSHATQVRQ